MSRMVISSTLLSVFAMAAAGQIKPNFTGDWVVDISASKSVDGRPIEYRGFRLIIMQSATSVYTVQESLTPAGLTAVVLDIPLDGEHHVSDIGGIKALVSARWEGSSLVLFNRRPRKDGTSIEVTRVLTLSADGTEMYGKTTVSGASVANGQNLEVFRPFGKARCVRCAPGGQTK